MSIISQSSRQAVAPDSVNIGKSVGRPRGNGESNAIRASTMRWMMLRELHSAPGSLRGRDRVFQADRPRRFLDNDPALVASHLAGLREKLMKRHSSLKRPGIIAGLLIAAAAAAQMTPYNAGFMQAMNASMKQMDRDMAEAPMNGDVDHDFATMMMPHHQGAIDMAKAELRYGKDPVMRRLAQEILVDQQSEIDAMQLWLTKSALNNVKKDR